MKSMKSFISAAAITTALTFLASVAGAVELPRAGAISSPASSSAALERVAWRGGRNFNGGYYRRHHRGIGGGAVIGGIVAGALIASAIREGRAGDGDIERCEETYRSFDRHTGTYTGYDGETHVCPYLE